MVCFKAPLKNIRALKLRAKLGISFPTAGDHRRNWMGKAEKNIRRKHFPVKTQGTDLFRPVIEKDERLVMM